MSLKIPPKDKRELGLFRFFVNQNVFINILYVGVFITGIVIWNFIMNREAFGNFDFDLAQITTPYPGATAEEVEQLVTMPIEEALKSVEGIDEIWSVSVEGLSVITIQLDPDVDNTQKTVRKIEREVDAVRTLDLPEDGDEPHVTEITAAFPVLTLGISGDVSEDTLRQLADDLEDDFLDIDGVSRVQKKGYKEKEIWVEADLKALKDAHLSLQDLIESIRQADHTSPGGRMEIEGQEIIVRTIGRLQTPEDVERVVVQSNEVGNIIQVKDLAMVVERLERERKFTRMNGRRSIEIDILKKDSGDTLTIDDEIKSIVNRYKENYPKVNFGYANEISFYIQRRLKVLLKNGLVGISLVLLIMILFLSPQSAFWSTSAIPFAFLGGIITMQIFGITINLLSLFAFILVSGMLVDNGIVVAEYIERKRAEGLPTFTAVSVGVSEMSLPVFAAALTTIIAFAPLAFMTGITGKFLRQMPLVLIACLICDLIECLFILPGHLYHYDWKFKILKWAQPFRRRAQHGLHFITRLYEALIRKVVKRPFTTMIMAILITSILFAVCIRFVRFQIFPNIIDIFAIKYELPVGTTLERNEIIAKGFEKIVETLPKDEIDVVVTQIGSQGDRNRSNSGTNVGEVRVFLNKAKEDRMDGNILIEQIRNDVEQYAKESGLKKYELEKIRGGPPTGRAIEVMLIGEDYGPLNALANEIEVFLKEIKGTYGILNDYDPEKKEYKLIINRPAVARAGLTISQVAMVVRSAFDGQEATEIKRVGATEDVKVKVKLKEEDRETDQTLDRLTITTPRGKQVPLRSLVTIEKGTGLLTILRNDGDRTITVKGEVQRDVITPDEVNKKLDAFLKSAVKKYPRMKYKFGGEKKNQDESMASLFKAIVIALGLIYLVLATLFRSYWEPVIIISIIPFALLGVFLSLLIPGKLLTLLVLIGFTGLTGVVVNNSILMIETFKRYKEQNNLSESEVVVLGTKERLRPILLTTLSTFFGVMPLGYGLGGKEPFLQDMAYSFGWGLMFCSIMTLIWIPAFHLVSVNIKTAIRKAYKGRE